MWYFFLWYAFLLISTTFGYTVVDHDYYKTQADNQQMMELRNTNSRGSIYSRSTESSPKGVFSVSTNLWTLAIDPSQSGSQDKLVAFLADVVFDEFCRGTGNECIDAMSSYLKKDLREQSDITDNDIKNMTKSYLLDRMNSPIDAVQIGEKVPESVMQEIEEWQDISLYFVVDNLYVNPTLVADPALLAERLSKTLGLTSEIVAPKLEIRKRRHLEILRRMSLQTRDTVNKRIIAEREAVKQKQLLPDSAIYPFIKIEDNLVRFYPEKTVAWQILWFVDNDGRGQYGIEGYFDDDLLGESPVQLVRKDSAGRPIGGYVTEEIDTNKSGIDISLTIDRNIQKEISSKLAKAVIDYRANKWSVIVMDPKTGAVIASVNYPDFDPNNFTSVYDIEKINYNKYPKPSFDLLGMPVFVEDTLSGSLTMRYEGKRVFVRRATDNEIGNPAVPKYKYVNNFGPGVYVNDVVGSLYEPGSVFKAVTVAIGLDTWEINPNDTYYDKWYVEIEYEWGVKRRISNVSSNCIGRHTYIHGLDWSCNVAMIDIIQKIGRSLFYKYIHDFGFGSKSDITLDGEVFSQITPYEKWSRTQLFTMSFWQWINVTLLQMAAAYSVLANGWIYMKPYIVDSITYQDGRTVKTIPTPLRRVIKEETSEKITAMLIDSVKNGFAKWWGVPGYIIAGKTWTSQIASRGGYEAWEPGRTITSYGWYAPANNPKFVLIVKLERPRSAIYSETTSSKLYSEIAWYLLEYYKVPKNQ
jgi:stage V sporulation protein D (sporulation-specific penicillin-binding protein)